MGCVISELCPAALAKKLNGPDVAIFIDGSRISSGIFAVNSEDLPCKS